MDISRDVAYDPKKDGNVFYWIIKTAKEVRDRIVVENDFERFMTNIKRGSHDHSIL